MNVPASPLASDAVPAGHARFGPRRLAFAIAFGIALPVFCLAIDPFVFSSSAPLSPLESPLLFEYRVVGYSATAVGIATLLIWLVLRRPAGFLAGSLAGGAAFAFSLGMVLLPFTLIGLLLIVGALGLVPFGTAWVFARHARGAWMAADRHRKARVWAAMGILVSCGLPWALQGVVNSEVRSALDLVGSTDPVEVERGVDRLNRLRFVFETDDLVWQFGRQKDPDRRERLANAYRRMTGEEAANRLARLRD